LRRDQRHQPVAVKELAHSLLADAWKDAVWRQGVQKKLRSRFAALRVRPAHRDYWRAEPHSVEWLLIEWPKGEAEPTKYWLSTLPAEIALSELVRMAKHRWIIERDYQELKQELGLGHFEGRGWRGLHHHATLCLAPTGSWWLNGTVFPLNAGRASSTTRPKNPAILPTARLTSAPSGIIQLPSPHCE
jgi:SRSO17 transposase